MRRLATILIGCVGVLGAAPGMASAAAAPAWTLDALGYPTAFKAGSADGFQDRGPGYVVEAYNVGGQATSGNFTVTFSLPKGLLPSPEFQPTGRYGSISGGEIPQLLMSCSALGRNVTCTGGAEGPVGPGEQVAVKVPVKVEAGASGVLAAKGKIEGGGAGAIASTAVQTPISSSSSPFGFVGRGPFGSATQADGAPSTQAGSHPYQLTVAADQLPLNGGGTDNSPLESADGGLRDTIAELPRGMVVDPQAVPRCKEVELESNRCPDGSQVGTIALGFALTGSPGETGGGLHQLYNMVPPPGHPASLAFQAEGGAWVHVLGSVSSDGAFTLRAAARDTLAKWTVFALRPTLWGVPSDASHDAQRGGCLSSIGARRCPVERTGKPFVTMPSACSGPLTTTVKINDWSDPSALVEGSYESTDLEGNPVGVDGCNQLAFAPQISAKATTDQGDSPSGLDFILHQPQSALPHPGTGADVVCAPGNWEGTQLSYTFQWLRDGTPIPGAVAHEYGIGDEDAGHSLQCEVSASTKAADTALATSAPLAVPPLPGTPVPVATKLPATQVRAETLTITGGSGSYVLSYDGKSTPDLPSSASAAEIQAALEGLSSIGAGNVEVGGASSPYTVTFIGALAEVEPLIAAKPTAEEAAHHEASPAAFSTTLGCNPGTWSGGPSFAYQWYAGGAPLGGETADTYAVPLGEPESSVQCEVAASNASGTTAAFSPGNPKALIVPDIGAAESAISLATANLKDATVTLPQGLSVNPSSANGLGACTSAQVGLASPIGASPVRFQEGPGHCPADAKLGSAEVTTPLLDHPLPGALYIAKPFDNPFGSLLAIYLVVEDEQSGTIAKLAGKVAADPQTGQLTTTFAENPELPLEDVKLNLFGGAGGALTTPLGCGEHTTTSTLVPWSTPQGVDAHPSDSFQTAGSCSASEAAAPKSLSFTAGTVDPLAGAYSPLVMKVSRPDGSQHLASIDLTLPPGLTARFAGLETCSDAQIAQAQARNHRDEGMLEQQSPSCPKGSEVATVTVGAGSGPNPYYAQGHAYLAGPYKGAPLSLAIITPAVAGPFDLGTATVRAAVYVNPETAQGRAVSDPLPQILEGIPLDIRSVVLQTTPHNFTLNPTSCEAMSLAGQVGTASGQSATVSSPFQVGGCSALPFKPKVSLALKGSVKRSATPRLIATVTAKEGEANIASAQVKLPHPAFLDQAHIRTICTRVQFAADQCPAGSIYGKAEAKTPLLGYTLSGPVYLRSSSHQLPDLVVKLKGPASQPIEIDIAGKTDSVKAALRNTFEAVPDAPVSFFRLELFGGKRGLIEISSGFCSNRKATVHLTAQSGKVYDTTPAVGAKCPRQGKHPKHGKSHGKHHG